MVASGVQLSMTEVSAAEALGDYRFNFATSGADSAKYVVQLTSSSVSGVANLPAIGGLEVSLAALLDSYQDFIWIDTLIAGDGGSGTPGQVVGINGLQSNPVDNITDARALAGALGIRAFRVMGSIALDQDYFNWRFESWTLGTGTKGLVALGSQVHTIEARFVSVVVTGGGADGSIIHAFECEFTGGHTGVNGEYADCTVGGTWNIQPNGVAVVTDCNTSGSFWRVSNSFATTAAEWKIHGHRGEVQIGGLRSGNTVNIGFAEGKLRLDTSTAVSGTLNVTGMGLIVGVPDGPSVTLDTTSFLDVSHLHRLNGENARTRLFFPTAAVVSGVAGATRNVPLGSASHMRVEVKPDAATDWTTTIDDYFVLFNYGTSANAGDAPKSSDTSASAPTDGTFNTISYPT
jgi:hypothetical protein